MTFAFNAIQGELDLVNPPDGSNYLFQYYDDGAFSGAPVVGYDPTFERLLVGDQTGTYDFFALPEQKFSCTNEVTGISGDEFPEYFDIIRILGVFSAQINPRDDTSGLIGASIYGGFGGRVRAVGNVDWTGIPFGSGIVPASLIGGFGSAEVATTGGTMDGATGILFTSTHSGFGGNCGYLIGGIFDAGTSDDGAMGTPTGTLDYAIGGMFTTGGSGIDIDSAISGWFFQPFAFDSGTGAGAPTINNATAINCLGRFSLAVEGVSTAASITGLQLSLSGAIQFTGSTATNWHGMAADSFNKLIPFNNASSANVSILHESGTEGTAENRFATPGGGTIVFGPGHGGILHYQGDRWHLVART